MLANRVSGAFRRAIAARVRLKHSEATAQQPLEDDGLLQEDEEQPPPPLDERARDKSRLSDLHRRKLHGIPPDMSAAPEDWHSLDRQRQLWAMYGQASGINPAICWPITEERLDLAEYEALANPDSLQVSIQKAADERLEHDREMQQRMDAIDGNLLKLKQWKKEIRERKNKKLAEKGRADSARKDMVEEVQEMFGYKISSRDPRFQEALEEKEAREKKEARLMKKQEKRDKYLYKAQRLANKPKSVATPDTTSAEPAVKDEQPEPT